MREGKKVREIQGKRERERETDRKEKRDLNEINPSKCRTFG